VHIADEYIISHDTLNVIKFKPKKTGYFKALVLSESNGEEAFDLLLEIVSPTERMKVLKRVKNNNLKMGEQLYKQEYAELNYEIPYQYVGKDLWFTFRQQNFTEEDEVETLCMKMFIELQISNSQPECKNYKTAQPGQVKTIKGTTYLDYPIDSQDNLFTVTQNANPFWFYQDYYFDSDYVGLVDDDGESYMAQFTLD